tara:strand:- start:102856 stop:103107 length:252 start_codon:yes stop_codon:yes gene_type:complete
VIAGSVPDLSWTVFLFRNALADEMRGGSLKLKLAFGMINVAGMPLAAARRQLLGAHWRIDARLERCRLQPLLRHQEKKEGYQL